MKLLHITATHLNPVGGIPVVLKNLVEAQNQIKGFEARVLSLKAGTNNMHSSFFDILGNEKIKEYLERVKPDVVILHSFYYMEYNSVVNTLCSLNIPYFMEPHGSFGKTAMHKSRLKKVIANNTIFRKQLKCARGYIFLNESEMADSIYRTQNDIVIPNGICKDSVLIEQMRKDEVWLYFIGRYDINHKGLDYLVTALDILDKKDFNYTIRFWGSGDVKTIQYLNESVKKFKNLKVKIEGSIFGCDKDRLLEQCGPMLLTSRYEGFPMTVLEAWEYGNPCLVTPGTNVYTEICENGLGWGCDLDAESIADGIERAFNEYSANRDEYIKKCKEYVSSNYTWNKIAIKSFEQIKKAIE